MQVTYMGARTEVGEVTYTDNDAYTLTAHPSLAPRRGHRQRAGVRQTP